MRDFDIINEAYKEVTAGSESPDWNAYKLPRPSFVVLTVVKTQEIVLNGGLQYFFESDWPGNPPYAVFIDALREIGAIQAANCLQKAVNNFPFLDPHKRCALRCEHLEQSRSSPTNFDSIIDCLGERMMDLNDETYARLENYIRENLSCFPKLRQKLDKMTKAKKRHR
jgi:hypothetical protein